MRFFKKRCRDSIYRRERITGLLSSLALLPIFLRQMTYSLNISQRLSDIARRPNNYLRPFPKMRAFHFSGMVSSWMFLSSCLASLIAFSTEYSPDMIFGTSMSTRSPGRRTSLLSFLRYILAATVSPHFALVVSRPISASSRMISFSRLCSVWVRWELW